MGLIVLMLIFMLLLSVPIRLQIDVLHSGQTLARIRLSAAGLARIWRMKLISSPHGHKLIVADASGQESALDPQRLHSRATMPIASMLRSSTVARRFLLRHIHLGQLDASLRLHLANAAHTALLTGFLRSLTAFIPASFRSNARIIVTPDFYQGQTILQARCILRFRLGTILLTAGLLLADTAKLKAMKAREAA